jgi:hypothetical protein
VLFYELLENRYYLLNVFLKIVLFCGFYRGSWCMCACGSCPGEQAKECDLPTAKLLGGNWTQCRWLCGAVASGPRFWERPAEA